MHPYSIDSKEHGASAVGIAVVAILLAWAMNAALTAKSWVVPWWAESPSPVLFFGLLHKLVDKALWRLPGPGLIWSTPDLNGTWEVEVQSSHDDFATTSHGAAHIKQSWSRVAIHFEMRHSRSESIAASVHVEKGRFPEVVYTYRNEPRADAKETMAAFLGTATVRLTPTGELEGDYFTGRGRGNVGRLRLRRRVQTKAPR